MQPRPEITVICGDTTRERFIAELRRLDVRIIRGDARLIEVLQAAELGQAYAMAVVTSDNLTNLRVGLLARQMRPDIHLVLRVFSDVLAEQLEGIFGIHTVFSTSALAAPTLAAASVLKGTSYAIDIGDQLLSTARLNVYADGDFVGQTPHELREQHGILVIVRRRKGRTMMVADDSPANLARVPLRTGDEIVVLANIHLIERLRRRGAAIGTTTEVITGPLSLPPSAQVPQPTSVVEDLRALTGQHTATTSQLSGPGQPELDHESQQMLEQLLQHGIHGGGKGGGKTTGKLYKHQEDQI
jgi:Trk K+ transport system NAD-binding subunit